jgi:very-short-patch-repair endonuclease
LERERYLEEANNKIHYIREKAFNDCRDIRKLKFDFYLPGLKMLVEYNGRQHYKYATHWRQTGETLAIQQRHDTIKKKYAVDNGYKFLVLKYDDKNIEQALRKAVA